MRLPSARPKFFVSSQKKFGWPKTSKSYTKMKVQKIASQIFLVGQKHFWSSRWHKTFHVQLETEHLFKLIYVEEKWTKFSMGPWNGQITKKKDDPFLQVGAKFT